MRYIQAYAFRRQRLYRHFHLLINLLMTPTFQLPVRTHYYARILYNLFSRSSFGTKDIDAVYHRKHGWETAVIHRWIIR